MTHDLKLSLACLCLALAPACAGDDGSDDGAAGSSGTAGDTAADTIGGGDDDGVDDGGAASTGGDDVMDDGSTGGDTMAADSTGGDTMEADSTGAETTGDESTGGDTTGGSGLATVSGTIFRAAATAPGIGQDAIGDIYLGLLIECTQDAASVASTVVIDGDLSNTDVGVPYTIEEVPDGTYFLAGFMDDNDDTDPDDPDAGLGDLAAAEGFGPACTQVDVVAGAPVMGADLTFNLVVPF